jgi:hypothetical protein
MPLMEMKIPTIVVPSTIPLVISPNAVGPFITPCQQEAVIEQTSLSLFLTAVTAVTGVGGL